MVRFEARPTEVITVPAIMIVLRTALLQTTELLDP